MNYVEYFESLMSREELPPSDYVYHRHHLYLGAERAKMGDEGPVVVCTWEEHVELHRLMYEMYKTPETRSAYSFIRQWSPENAAAGGTAASKSENAWWKKDHSEHDEKVSASMIGNTNGRGSKGWTDRATEDRVNAYKEQCRERAIKQWADPAYREKMKEAHRKK